MWKNIVETNIMVGTHADSLIAEAVLKNIPLDPADLEEAWKAVWKDATVAPERDWDLQYDDREQVRPLIWPCFAAMAVLTQLLFSTGCGLRSESGPVVGVQRPRERLGRR